MALSSESRQSLRMARRVSSTLRSPSSTLPASSSWVQQASRRKTALGRPRADRRGPGPKMSPSAGRVVPQKVNFWGQGNKRLTSSAVRRRTDEYPPARLLLPGGLEPQRRPPVLVQGHKSGWPTKPPMESGCASTSPCSENEVLRTLPQLRVLRLGFLKDGNSGVGIFPEREEVLIRSPGFGRISRNNVGPSQPQMRQCAGQLVLNYAGVIEDLLELGGSGGALLHCQIRLTSQVDRITAKTYDRIRLPQLVRCSSRQCRN